VNSFYRSASTGNLHRSASTGTEIQRMTFSSFLPVFQPTIYRDEIYEKWQDSFAQNF